MDYQTIRPSDYKTNFFRVVPPLCEINATSTLDPGAPRTTHSAHFTLSVGSPGEKKLIRSLFERPSM